MEEKSTSCQEKVISLLAKQLGKDPKTITPEKRFAEDLAADSLDVVEILMTLEGTFGVVIPDEAAFEMKKVEDLVKYIDKNKN